METRKVIMWWSEFTQMHWRNCRGRGKMHPFNRPAGKSTLPTLGLTRGSEEKSEKKGWREGTERRERKGKEGRRKEKEKEKRKEGKKGRKRERKTKFYREGINESHKEKMGCATTLCYATAQLLKLM